MQRSNFLALFGAVSIPLFSLAQLRSDVGKVDYVNPLMGTQSSYALSSGNTYPSVSVPWGMNAWCAQTGKNGDGWMYTYDANKIRGFKQTHQPSPWINDYGCFSIMPVAGRMRWKEDERASWFSHKAEKVTPYSYEVYLADYHTEVAMAPTERGAVFQIHYKGSDSAWLVLDGFNKGSGVKYDRARGEISGYTSFNNGGVPDNFKNYFVIKIDAPVRVAHTWHGKELRPNTTEATADHAGLVLGLGAAPAGQKITLRVASSFISLEQARLNLEREIGIADYATVALRAKQQWNKELGKIDVQDSNIDAIRTFYSCLYRVLLFPRMFYEINAEAKVVHYSPYNGQVLPGYMFTDNGFWDTFRAVFPFFNMMYPELNSRIMEGLVNTYLESGWLPEWASPGHRDCMIGSNSASLVTDAWLKGVRGFDIEVLYEAMVKNAENEGPLGSVGRRGAPYYTKLGYVPNDVGINESAARTLEYAYADYCLYRLAKVLNKPEAEVNRWYRQSMNYKNLFLKKNLLMSGRSQTGQFPINFNPFKWGGDFTEGNSWHYTWSVFHDIEGLKELMGGDAMFVNMLDSVFNLPPVFDESYYGQVIHEIREMQIMNMGQYAHGNQPIQHMPYLYQYTTQPWKTAYWVRQIMNRMYSANPDGYCGDEDNGQTSAWYVFSALGFYPVCPGSNEYVLGAPMFQKATVQLGSGKQLVMSAKGNGPDSFYPQAVHLNGKAQSRSLSHDALMKGGKLTFTMGTTPATSSQNKATKLPFSLSVDMPRP